ncbi:serine/threonine-protein phosphatase 6 regulatory ankyrin repeat subunit C-like [Gossypium australe]|uniref:Serine/threonine-protein phosphatase 6 regulatory ankyrin repeat subunit C-like n=1 Tax=Gossypium australe TaxID=47621 RepID=A0A5B6UZR2_9ROSI|nr:serine/threonine-protein phosphatase 6 regulatory ankyrin repeat subunit C-like [Gossypium australe]
MRWLKGSVQWPIDLSCHQNLSESIYHVDPSHIVSVDKVEVRPDLTYDEEPVEVIAHKEKCCDKTKKPTKPLRKLRKQ